MKNLGFLAVLFFSLFAFGGKNIRIFMYGTESRDRGEMAPYHLVDLFNSTKGREHGITVVYLYKRPEILEALVTGDEEGLAFGDLLLLPDAQYLGQATQHNFLKKLRSSFLEAHIPYHLRSKNGEWFAISKRYYTLFMNTEKIKYERPHSWLDLGQEQYLDALCLESSLKDGPLSFVLFLHQAYGYHDTVKIISSWKKNNPRVIGRYENIFKLIDEGACVLGYGSSSEFGKFLKTQGDDLSNRSKVRMMYSFDEGVNQEKEVSKDLSAINTHINITSISLLKNSRHPKAAKIFIEWLLSASGQHYWSRLSYEHPVNYNTPLAEIHRYIHSFAAAEIIPESLFSDFEKFYFSRGKAREIMNLIKW